MFVDTNVILYSIDATVAAKHLVALRTLLELRRNASMVVSAQVINEAYYGLTAPRRRVGMAFPDAREVLVQMVAAAEVVDLTAEVSFTAMELCERFRLSFWDSLILAAAIQAGCQELLTEDLQHGQVIEGVLIRSPFHQVEET